MSGYGTTGVHGSDVPAGTVTGDVTAGAVTIADRARKTWRRVAAIAGAVIGVALVTTCTACATTEAVLDKVAGAAGYERAGTADLAGVTADLVRLHDDLAPRAHAEAEAATLREQLRIQTDLVVELKADIERLQDDHTIVLGAVHVDYQLEIERLVRQIKEAQAFIALFPADLVALIMGQQAVADTEGGAEGD